MRQLLLIVMAIFASPGLMMPSLLLAQESDPHASHRKMMHQAGKEKPNQEHITLPDTELITQNGEHKRLRSDIVAGRIVVIDFVYTTCTTVCPVLSAILRQVQQRLEDPADGEVLLVSISVDPVRDTPARLKAYADKLQVGDGWVWLTGDKQTVDGVLEQLGAYSPDFINHPSMVLVGDPVRNDWTRYLGFPSADQIIGKVEELTMKRAMLSSARSR